MGFEKDSVVPFIKKQISEIFKEIKPEDKLIYSGDFIFEAGDVFCPKLQSSSHILEFGINSFSRIMKANGDAPSSQDNIFELIVLNPMIFKPDWILESWTQF